MAGLGKLLRDPCKLVAVTAFLGSAAYLHGIADDRYGSESRFTVKSQMEGAASGLDLGILGGGNAAKQDQLVIRDFLMSSGVMRRVVEEFGLERISAPGRDVLYQIDAQSPRKEMLAHYRSLVDFTYDEEASITKLVVQAFDAATAQEMNAFLVAAAEDYINEFSRTTSERFIEFARQDMEKAKAAVAEVQSRIRAAQGASNLVSPETDIEVIASTLSRLEGQLVESRTALSSLLQFMHEDTHQVQGKREEIANLESQIEGLRARLSADDGADLAQASVEFAALQSELEFANVALASTLKTLEGAKMQAMSSRKYLMLIETPSLPDEAEYPRRWQNTLYALLLVSLAYFLVSTSMTMLRGPKN
jgi:capsular polysaccharide transport system permease protein